MRYYCNFLSWPKYEKVLENVNEMILFFDSI